MRDSWQASGGRHVFMRVGREVVGPLVFFGVFVAVQLLIVVPVALGVGARSEPGLFAAIASFAWFLGGLRMMAAGSRPKMAALRHEIIGLRAASEWRPQVIETTGAGVDASHLRSVAVPDDTSVAEQAPSA